MKLNAGMAGNNQSVGEHLAEWAREHAYSPVIELPGLPEAVETGLTKACVALWKAAEAEAAAIMARERLRIAEAIAAERELRHDALGMVDARDAVIEAQRNEIAWFANELERQKAFRDGEGLGVLADRDAGDMGHSPGAGGDASR